MPRDGAGTYTLPPSYLAVTGQTILASQHNPPLEDLASSMTGSLPRNGSAPMQTALPMGGYQINNMADGVLPTDAATVGQSSTAAATAITTAPPKATPVDADTIPLVDSAAGNIMKRLTWANLKALFQPVNAVLTALGGIGTAVPGDIIYSSAAGVWARRAKGTDGQVLTLASGLPAWATVTASGVPDAVIEDQKSSGTAGGAFSSGAWRIRDLNTKVRDPSSLITVTTNTFVSTANGWVEWSVPFFNVDRNQTRLFNVTDSAVAGVGTSSYAGNGLDGNAFAVGGAPVTAGKTYRLEHQCSLTNGATGFGRAASFGTEVYTRIKFWRA